MGVRLGLGFCFGQTIVKVCKYTRITLIHTHICLLLWEAGSTCSGTDLQDDCAYHNYESADRIADAGILVADQSECSQVEPYRNGFGGYGGGGY